MALGPSENQLLAEGHSPVAVLYAREIERVEFANNLRTARAVEELVAAGVLHRDDPEVRPVVERAQLSFAENFQEQVDTGHSQHLALDAARRLARRAGQASP
jgi:hypothetical protein